MSTPHASSFDIALARVCTNCLVCRRARRQQRGGAFWLVKRVEVRLCPFCRAYERVHGWKAHEPRFPDDPSFQARGKENSIH